MSNYTQAKSPILPTSVSAFDSIAEDYQASKKMFVREALKNYNVFHYLGDIEGKSILDLACGDGYYQYIRHYAAIFTL